MKILMYTSVLAGGGAERVLCQLANNFCNENEVILVASYKEKNEYYIDEKVKKIYIDDNQNNKHSFKQMRRLRQIVKKEKTEVCLSFLPNPNFKMILATIGLKLKLIISVRNDPKKEYASLTNKILAKFLYPLADGVVFQTRDAQSYFPKKIQNKSVVIMNQVDQKFFETKRLSQDYWIATGRLNKQKNYPMMIKAFKKVVDIYPNEILRIYGKGELESEISNLIKSLKLEKNVLLMGQTDNVPNVLSHAKGFLLSSDYEGMPNGLLEALAMGIPCISTDCPCGGPKEIINSGKNGFLIKVNDYNDLKEKIILLLNSQTLSSKISNTAVLKSKNYTPKIIYEKWKAYIKSFI